jgi:hypothetical protein
MYVYTPHHTSPSICPVPSDKHIYSISMQVWLCVSYMIMVDLNDLLVFEPRKY